jgi:hypothetical protein
MASFVEIESLAVRAAQRVEDSGCTGGGRSARAPLKKLRSRETHGALPLDAKSLWYRASRSGTKRRPGML